VGAHWQRDRRRADAWASVRGHTGWFFSEEPVLMGPQGGFFREWIHGAWVPVRQSEEPNKEPAQAGSNRASIDSGPWGPFPRRKNNAIFMRLRGVVRRLGLLLS